MTDDKKIRRGTAERNGQKKPPLPTAALVAKKKKIPTIPVSRPTPGAKGYSGRSPLPSPRGKPDFKRSVTNGSAPHHVHKISAADIKIDKKKNGSLKGRDMCPTCGTLVSKGIIKLSKDSQIGTFSINPKDVIIDTTRVLGQGGFGVVYLGDYQATEVAVKVMLGDHKPKPDEIAEWKNEVDIMTHLRHPNILSILGAVFETKRLAIVTEFCAKGSLRKVVRDIAKGARLEVTWARKFDWLVQVAKGMAFLHHKKIHHRDLKASNVFVSGETMKIADFGLSNFRIPGTPLTGPSPVASGTPLSLSVRSKEGTGPLAELRVDDNFSHPPPSFEGSPGGLPPTPEPKKTDGDSNATADASGTFAFVPPETWAGKPFTDAGDVYAMGVMIIEIITTKVPFDDVPEEDEDKWANRIRKGTARPVLPTTIGGEDVPRSLIKLCKGCLSFDPAGRPPFRKVVGLLQKEMEDPYAFVTCPIPYESDDEGDVCNFY